MASGEDCDEVQLLNSSPHHSDEVEEEDSSNNIRLNNKKRKAIVDFLKHWWKMIVIIGTPIILSPLPLSLQSTESRGAYAIAITAVYWVTEALPIAVTALSPLWLFPALGVLSARDTAGNYLSDSNMLFVGGLMMAVAIEKWNVHKRIALMVLLAFGSSPRWLLLGLMVTTAFLSMWISNTAVAAMMLAIAHAVLQELSSDQNPVSMDTGEPPQSVRILYAKRHNQESEEDEEEITMQVDLKENENKEISSLLETGERITKDESLERLAKVMVLGVAYAANIGGTATLTGTGPNIVLSGLSISLFPGSGGINFGLWFVFATPAMILILLLSWLYLSLLYCDDSFVWVKKRCLKRSVKFQSQRAKRVIRQQYRELGKVRYAEVVVIALFALLALLWLLREPRFIPGWASIFRSDGGTSYFSDSSTAMFIVFLLFIIPSNPPWNSGCWRSGSNPLLDWNTVQNKLAWNVVILLGAGLALSAGAKESGLSSWIGQQLLSLSHLPVPAIAFCISVIIAAVTEVMSNIATTTLFLPVLAELAIELRVNPLYFMIPAAVSASFAFMLPVATPPNAMAFSYGYLKVYNMVLTGLFMNILCVTMATVFLNTTGRWIFHLDTFPSWAENITLPTACLQWTSINSSLYNT